MKPACHLTLYLKYFLSIIYLYQLYTCIDTQQQSSDKVKSVAVISILYIIFRDLQVFIKPPSVVQW